MAVAPTHSRLATFSAGGLDVEVHLWDIPYLVPFRIARPDPNEESSRTAFVHITDRATGLEGWGEGCADPYYGDTPETIAAVAPREGERGGCQPRDQDCAARWPGDRPLDGP